MGCSTSNTNKAREKSKQIDKLLENEKSSLASTLKLLLLGASESGKSTLVKQMKILHKDGFSRRERENYKEIITSNIISIIQRTALAMKELEVDFDSNECQRYASSLMNHAKLIEKEDYFLAIMGDQLRAICNDRGFTSCIDRGSEFDLSDAAKYFCDNIDRITTENYVPTDKDILFARMPTTGIIETDFLYKGYKLQLVDVGGQKSERRKWIHCFENVTAVMFTAAMSFYDQTMPGDKDLNRLQESMDLFVSITNQACFNETSFLLFLNKKDIFQEKLKKISLKYCFPEYTGANTFEECSVYIQKKFEKSLNKKRDVYVHFTNATDTDNINFVFQSSMSTILHQSLKETGFC